MRSWECEWGSDGVREGVEAEGLEGGPGGDGVGVGSREGWPSGTWVARILEGEGRRECIISVKSARRVRNVDS